jgi:hypothetical protein
MKVFNVYRTATYPKGKLQPVFEGIPADCPKWARSHIEHWDNWIRNRKHCVLHNGGVSRDYIEINEKILRKPGKINHSKKSGK